MIEMKETILNDIFFRIREYIDNIRIIKIGNTNKYKITYKKNIKINIENKQFLKEILNNLNSLDLKYPEIMVDYENQEIFILRNDKATLTIVQNDDTPRKLYSKILELCNKEIR